MALVSVIKPSGERSSVAAGNPIFIPASFNLSHERFNNLTCTWHNHNTAADYTPTITASTNVTHALDGCPWRYSEPTTSSQYSAFKIMFPNNVDRNLSAFYLHFHCQLVTDLSVYFTDDAGSNWDIVWQWSGTATNFLNYKLLVTVLNQIHATNSYRANAINGIDIRWTTSSGYKAKIFQFHAGDWAVLSRQFSLPLNERRVLQSTDEALGANRVGARRSREDYYRDLEFEYVFQDSESPIYSINDKTTIDSIYSQTFDSRLPVVLDRTSSDLNNTTTSSANSIFGFLDPKKYVQSFGEEIFWKSKLVEQYRGEGI